MPLITGLYVREFYTTNYWFVCEGCMPLITGLYVRELYATNYWFVCEGVVCH